MKKSFKNELYCQNSYYKLADMVNSNVDKQIWDNKINEIKRSLITIEKRKDKNDLKITKKEKEKNNKILGIL